MRPRHPEPAEERAEDRVADVETSYSNDNGEYSEADDECGIGGVLRVGHRWVDAKKMIGQQMGDLG